MNLDSITVTGIITFASKLPSVRIAIRPDQCMCSAVGPAECVEEHAHKRVIANLLEPANVRKGEEITIRGQFASQGYESVVIRYAHIVVPRSDSMDT